MQNTLHHHPPQQALSDVQDVRPAIAAAERGSVLDRLSLRLGLWLLLRSSRRAQQRAELRERNAARAHREIRDQYEREAAHARLLLATRSWR